MVVDVTEFFMRRKPEIPVEDPLAALIILIEEMKRIPRPPIKLPPIPAPPPPQVEVLPPPRAPLAKKLPQPHQIVSVPAGEKKRVYYFEVPKGHVSLVQHVGNTWFDNTFLYWYMDGDLVFVPHIDFEIADVNRPEPVLPWLPAREDIVWEAKNESSLDCLFEIRCSGIYLPVADIEILLQMGLPVGGGR